MQFWLHSGSDHSVTCWLKILAASCSPVSLVALVPSPIRSLSSAYIKNIIVKTSLKIWNQFWRYFGLQTYSISALITANRIFPPHVVCQWSTPLYFPVLLSFICCASEMPMNRYYKKKRMNLVHFSGYLCLMSHDWSVMWLIWILEQFQVLSALCSFFVRYVWLILNFIWAFFCHFCHNCKFLPH